MLVSLLVTRAASTADARELYRLGLELYDERQYEAALQQFEESFRALASPNSKLYVARCLRTLGRREEAIAAYEQATHLAKSRLVQEPKYESTYQNAWRELAVLRPPPQPEQRLVAATWTAAGIGALGFASFGVFGAMARSRHQSLESHCAPLPCPASESGTVASGRDFQVVANVSLTVGITAAVATFTLYVLGRPKTLPYGQIGLSPNSLQFWGEF